MQAIVSSLNYKNTEVCPYDQQQFTCVDVHKPTHKWHVRAACQQTYTVLQYCLSAQVIKVGQDVVRIKPAADFACAEKRRVLPRSPSPGDRALEQRPAVVGIVILKDHGYTQHVVNLIF